MTDREWASWALLGDDAARVPLALEDLHRRVERAIRAAIISDREKRSEVKAADKHVVQEVGA